ncbi:MAG: type II toxin-antitoxin system RelE/ParE family toxin [Planctomycetaceae bacterium]|nr:type II toxin-antitoxin system RelE/ParE family toxin [Planctomycetaceae bacterium]
MAHVTFRPRAERDIDEVYLYLGKQSSDLAVKFLQQVEFTTAALAQSPDLGIRYCSVHDRITDIRVYRIRRFPNHLVFYRSVENGIEVLRLLHGARDIESLFDSGSIQ